MVSEVRVEHTGTFNMSDTREQWKPFTSDQRVIARRPGYRLGCAHRNGTVSSSLRSRFICCR